MRLQLLFFGFTCVFLICLKTFENRTLLTKRTFLRIPRVSVNADLMNLWTAGSIFLRRTLPSTQRNLDQGKQFLYVYTESVLTLVWWCVILHDCTDISQYFPKIKMKFLRNFQEKKSILILCHHFKIFVCFEAGLFMIASSFHLFTSFLSWYLFTLVF